MSFYLFVENYLKMMETHHQPEIKSLCLFERVLALVLLYMGKPDIVMLNASKLSCCGIV